MKTAIKILLGVGAVGAGYLLYQRFGVSSSSSPSTGTGGPTYGGMLQATSVLAPPKVMVAPPWNPKSGAAPTPEQLRAMTLTLNGLGNTPRGVAPGRATRSMFWGIGTQSMADYADPQVTRAIARVGSGGRRR